MTVSSATNEAAFIGNDAATTFPLPFRFFADSDIIAQLIDDSTGAVYDMTLGIDYTLTGAGEPEVSGSATGQITLPAPLPSGYTLFVRRELPLTQPTDIVNQGRFFPETHETVFDRLAMQIQQAVGGLGKALRVRPTEPAPAFLPPINQRAHKLLSFDENGNPVALAPASGSAAELAIDLANSTDPAKGAGLVGYMGRTVFTKLTDVVSVTDHGLVGDGVADDTAAFIAARDAALAAGKGLGCPPGKSIKLSGDVSLKGVRNIDIQSDIVITGGTLTVGGAVNSGQCRIALRDVTDGTNALTTPPPVNPVVRVTGVANSEITIGTCNYIQLYADAAVTADRLVAYNQIRLTGAVSLLELTDSGAALSYVNENFIYASRVIRYRITGVGYAHNHNKLFHPCMEGASAEVTITGNNVSANQVYGARFEATDAAPGVTFGAGTYSNTVIQTWSGIGDPRNQFSLRIPVTDLGEGNCVTTEAAHIFQATPLFSINANSVIAATSAQSVAPNPRITPSNAGVDNIVGRQVLIPGLAGVSPVFPQRYWAMTEPIPVRLGDVVSWDFDFDGAQVRTAVFVLDANMQPLTSEGAGGAFWTQAGCTFNTTYGRYSQVADQPPAMLPGVVARVEVAFIRVALYASGFVRNLGATLHTQPIGRGRTQQAAAQKSALLSINATPTRGYLPLDFMIYETTGGTWKRVTFQYESRVSGALSAGATSVTVAAISTVADGDICGILLDNGQTHWTTVSGLSGSTFTIAAIPVGRSAPDGSRIVFNRWA